MPPVAGRKKKGVRRRRRRANVIAAIVVLVIFVVTVVVAVVFLAGRIRTPRRAAGGGASAPARVLYEEPAPEHLVVINSGRLKHKPAIAANKTRELPLVAIVIDDMGYNLDVGRALIASGMNLSFAFLPQRPHTAELLAMAGRYGRDRLLHFPMEPANANVSPGPGAIYLDTPYDEVKAIFRENLSRLPGVLGINNHMGSRYTQNSAAMREFLGLLFGRDLFFLDSFTSANSVGYRLAREMGIRTARRDVFLDNVQDRRKIRAQLVALVRIAGRKGWAIGIGHPHQATFKTITAEKRWFAQRVRLVGVSRLVH